MRLKHGLHCNSAPCGALGASFDRVLQLYGQQRAGPSRWAGHLQPDMRVYCCICAWPLGGYACYEADDACIPKSTTAVVNCLPTSFIRLNLHLELSPSTRFWAKGWQESQDRGCVPVSAGGMARRQRCACTATLQASVWTGTGEACLKQSEEGSECGDAPGVWEAQKARLRDQRHAGKTQQNGNAHCPVVSTPLVSVPLHTGDTWGLQPFVAKFCRLQPIFDLMVGMTLNPRALFFSQLHGVLRNMDEECINKRPAY